MPNAAPKHRPPQSGAPRHERPRLTSRQRGYDARWDKARRLHLIDHPLCAHCLARGLTVPAREVDHIVAHKGDMGKFWDRANWQSLCKRCHSRKTAKEDGGFGRG